MTETSFTIASVENETGISKDILRMWERRYGFPSPQRAAGGDRLYPADQVARLRQIKRLVDQGHRPGRLMAATAEELSSLAPRRMPAAHDGAGAGEEIAGLLDLLAEHDAAVFQQGLQQSLARQGLGEFVLTTLTPLTREVGFAWADGRFAVFEEHLFTELATRVLRRAIDGLPTRRTRPRVLLATVPDEPHGLGLLMLEALLALEGAECIPLGTGMPMLEIASAAEAHRADIVALSFSLAFPRRRVRPLLAELRALLPARVGLWAGGRGAQGVAPPAGATVLPSLPDGLAALAAWRAAA